MENTQYKIDYFDNLNELFELYDNVRRAVILVENFDDERKMYIAPINQLRSALDHVFKAINTAKETEQSQYELKEAKEHLDRAGYDALELLAANLGEKIINQLNVYRRETITTVFPTYYEVIRPKLSDVKEVVATLRTEKKIDAEKSFTEYFNQITELIDIDKEVSRRIPALEEFENRRKREKVKDWAIGAGTTIGLGILLGLLEYFLNFIP